LEDIFIEVPKSPANEADATGTTSLSVDVEWCDDDYAPSNHQDDFWVRTQKKLPRGFGP
jgi:hypothetical protein